MNIKSIVSKQFTLETRDWLKSLFYAVIVPVLLQIQSVLDQGALNFNWLLLGQVALSAVVAHLLRKFTEPSKLITVQDKIPKEKIPVAEIVAQQANEAQDTPPVIVETAAGTPPPPPPVDPPPIGDPTNPKPPIKNPE